MSEHSLQTPKAKSKAHDVFRGTVFQAVLLGLISFTQPGIWTAMNNLGAIGQAEPHVINAVNVITFVIMIVLSQLASMIGNLIGMKWIVAVGTLGYVPYSAALYCNSIWGTQWFLTFGAVTCGISASALWPGEAAIAVGYPEVARRGVCISIWMALGKLGSIIATAIQLAINKDSNTTGAISPSTYLVLVAIQCLGLPLSLLLAPPDKLTRKDGKKPIFANSQRSFKTQFRGFLAQFKRKEVLLLIPAFVTAQWGVTYQGNYMAAYFTVRARTLAGFIIAVVGAISNVLAGWWLDSKHLKRTTEARWSWYFLLTLFTLVWIWNLVVQERWARESPGEIDWISESFGEGVAIFILYQ
ncbi:major facilitator superfamily domain-containing protein [Colletotrichum phormii]|uniref:Major facilitator superfamily domain-containing protein n=1 Tax=Colletotrichum phormii TaxID=359342 RepID=A0AAI9ZW33_9PEZI|nr:major facilitator superfamily domain-containing protein [Colletotrichum phormii]KAK1639289.1 major facilitator superfamily domain-containing protein [Colletotrichum phormii]